MSYAEFLATKAKRAPSIGRQCDASEVNPMLHDWQREIVAWAVRKGRAAIWADTGLGKTFMQIEWARLSLRPELDGEGTALIVAPLAVCQQTIREGAKLGVPIRYLREDDGKPGILITNFEMMSRFAPETLDAVVLDEASILKQSDGKTRTKLIEHFASVPARLSCTATPAPNDPEELTSQSEFLGVMPRVEMLSAYFVHDDKGWRQKGHASGPMYRWMASWAVALRRPSDIGYGDTGYVLPPLTIVPEVVDVEVEPEDGALFRASIGGVSGRAQVRRATLDARIERMADVVDAAPKSEPWLIFCGLNDEQDALAKEFGEDAFSIQGSMTPESKVDLLYRWLDGERPILVSKTSILGMGINAQHCARVAFVGMNDSFEAFYQGVRRCWRYGQTRPVSAHVIVSQLESQIAANVERKERQTSRMVDGLVAAMSKEWIA
jgi:Helicase conserved C-terminal domain/SNF2-related domain